MREIKFKFLMEDGTVTTAYYLKELIDSDAYINIECEWNSKIKKELQYTGLKDKQGKEIYEGDIVNIHMAKVSCHTKKTIFKKTVSFENGSFTLEWIDKEKQGFWATFTSLSTNCSIEVIGNIYEHSHLLDNN